MKKSLLKSLAIGATFVFILSSGVSLAQTEVTVDPGLNTLSDALTANPGATLVLTRGGDYVVDNTLQIIVPTIIRGESEPSEDKPAVIQLTKDPGAAGGLALINVSADLTIKDVGIMGYCPDGQQFTKIFDILKDTMTLTIDGCVLQGSAYVMFTNGKAGVKFVIKNNKIFNSAGREWDNWTGVFAEWEVFNSNFKAYNNTYFVTGRVHAIAGAVTGSDSIYHNTYCNTFGDTFFPNWNDNVVIKNNIFFNAQIRGYVGERTIPYPSGDSLYTWGGDYSDATGEGLYDTLCGSVSITPILLDTTKSRHVEVTNNILFMDKTVLDFYADNNVTEQPFLNKDARRLAPYYGWNIADNYVWEEGDAIDPKFAMGEQPESIFVPMFLNRQQRHLPAIMQSADFPYSNAWRPGGETEGEFIWPLPFNLKPTISLESKSDDGYPLGDLNWYGADVVAAFEAGDPYPYTSIKENRSADFGLKIYGDRIHYNLTKNADVTISLYDTKGALVATVFNGNQAGGEQILSMPNLKNSIYICKLRVGNSVQVAKVAVVK